MHTKPTLLLYTLLVLAGLTGLAPMPRLGVTSPQSGDVIRGVITVSGTTATIGFQSAEVYFAFDGEDQPADWFLLSQSREAVTDGPLATWDTTTIADGMYRIRIVVNVEGGEKEERVVPGLRVSNYSPTETPGPQSPAAAVELTQEPSAASVESTFTPYPTPLPLAENPARVTPRRLQEAAVSGVLAALAILLAGVGYVLMRSRLHR